MPSLPRMSIHLQAAALRPASTLALPFARCVVQAGFPSPADDCSDQRMDLNRELVRRPASTFVVRVQGDSMLGGAADLRPDDLLVVDRSVEAQPGDVVVAAVGGEFTVKRLRQRGARLVLVPENGAYAEVTLDDDAQVWGVVTARIRRFRRP